MTTRTKGVTAATRDKQRQAVQLRLSGATYANIATAVGYAGASGARYAVEVGLKMAIIEPAQEVLAMELHRLDQLLVGLWPAATNNDHPSIDRVLKIMDRRAKYLGLDQIKVDVTTRDGDLADLDAALQALTGTPSSPAGLAFNSPTGTTDPLG